MPESLLADYIPEQQLAVELRKALITLRVWRGQRKGPPFIKNGRDVLYSRSGVQKWLKSQEVNFSSRP